MFEPRPEIRIATRRAIRHGALRSRPRQTPSALRPAHGAATLAGLDSANLRDRLARARQSGGHVLHSIFADNHDHADATVEGAGHFFGRDSPAGLQERENLRLFPAIGFYDRVASLASKHAEYSREVRHRLCARDP